MSQIIQAQVTAMGEFMSDRITELQAAITLATQRAEMLMRQRNMAEEEAGGWKVRAMQSEQQRQALRAEVVELREDRDSQKLRAETAERDRQTLLTKRTKFEQEWRALTTIGTQRADTMAMLLELARRYELEAIPTYEPLADPRAVAKMFSPRLMDAPVEEFHVAILNAQHRMERDVLITRGLLNSSLVHAREVFREAIAERAAAIILVHNHPSGDPTPSAEDRLITEQLVSAGRLLDIPVHDHVIIGRDRYVSFAEAGLL